MADILTILVPASLMAGANLARRVMGSHTGDAYTAAGWADTGGNTYAASSGAGSARVAADISDPNILTRVQSILDGDTPSGTADQIKAAQAAADRIEALDLTPAEIGGLMSSIAAVYSVFDLVSATTLDDVPAASATRIKAVLHDSDLPALSVLGEMGVTPTDVEI